MPLTKNKYERWHVIDECLQNKSKRWTWKSLQAALAERDIFVSRRTVFQDISDMNREFADRVGDKHEELIAFDRNRRTFYYTVENFSITNSPLRKEDYAVLREFYDIFAQFKELPPLEGMNNLLLRLQQLFKLPPKQPYSPIQFEKLPPQKGLQFLNPLYEHIVKENVLKIYYKPFYESEMDVIVRPYLLKEYSNRWYLLGWCENVREIHIYPLDRKKVFFWKQTRSFIAIMDLTRCLTIRIS